MCLAVPGLLLEIANGNDPLAREGRVAFDGLVKVANLAFVPEARMGDYVLIHAGIAIAVIDEKEALRTLALLSAAGHEERGGGIE